jgi:hypothetical protein
VHAREPSLLEHLVRAMVSPHFWTKIVALFVNGEGLPRVRDARGLNSDREKHIENAGVHRGGG